MYYEMLRLLGSPMQLFINYMPFPTADDDFGGG